MSFQGSISIGQSSTSTLNITDNSTGSDPNIYDRHLTFTRSDGSKIVPVGTTTDYVDFPIGSDTIAIALLARDLGLQVLAEWFSTDPIPGSTYTYQIPFGTAWFTYEFLYGLTQAKQVQVPGIVQRGNYFQNKARMWADALSALNSVSLGLDIVNCQQELNDAYNMINKPSLYF